MPADYLVQFYSDLREVIGAAWPEVVPNGIHHAMELSTVAFERQAKAGRLPAAAMDGALQPTNGWGQNNRVEEGPITLYYVVPNIEGIDGLLARLNPLRTTLLAASGGTGAIGEFGQVIGYPALSISMSLPANAYFLASNKPFFAGAVIANCVVGVEGRGG